MSAQAEPVEQVTPALREQDGEVQWAPWRERNFSRENRGDQLADLAIWISIEIEFIYL